MPKEIFILVRALLGLSHEGAYTSRCQMPEYEQTMRMDFFFKKGDGLYLSDHTNLFGSKERNWDVEVRDGGYVRGGVGGCSTFRSGVNGSSFFIPNLFTPNPVPQYSWFHQMIPNTPSSVLLLLCAIRNSLLNRLTFST